MKRSNSTKAALAVVNVVFVVLGVCGPVTVAQPPNIAEQPLTLRAEDLNGHPIPHLRFAIVPLEYISPEHRSAVFVLTDHRGVAETKVLTGIRYRIDFSEEWIGDIESLTFNGIVSAKPLVVTIPENPSTLHVVFSQTYRVTGTIRTTADSALQDVSLDLLGTARGDCYDCYPVEPDGAFALVTRTLPITIRPSDTDERWLFDPEHITVTEENQRDGLLFVASLREGERLQGRVEELGAGTPVAHASLMATWSCGSSVSVRRLVADSAGEFELPCIEGCTFRIEVESIGPYRRRLVTKTVASCDDELVLQVSRGGRLFGQVTDQWHDPIPDLAIRALAGTQRHATQTDEHGAYEFIGLPPGSYALTVNDYDSPVEHRQLVLVAENGGVPTAVVGEELVDTRLDLRAIEGATVCLTIVDPEQQPLKFRTLHVFLHDREAHVDLQRARMGIAQEKLCSRTLAPGHYLVRAGKLTGPFIPVWWPGEEDRDLATTVEVIAGKDVEIGPMMVRPVGVIRVSLADEGPAPDPERVRVWLQEFAEDAEISEWRMLEPDHIFTIDSALHLTPIPVGRWHIRVCAEESCKTTELWQTTDPVQVRIDQTAKATLGRPGDRTED